MIPVKAAAPAFVDRGGNQRIAHMPAEAIPVVVAICAVFSTFIVVVGGVSTWVNLGEGRRRTVRDQ